MPDNLENHPTYRMFKDVSKNITNNLYQGHFHYEGAIEILENYLPLARNMNSSAFVGDIYRTLTKIEAEVGHHSQAVNYCQQAIAAYEETQNPALVSAAVCGLGELYRESGETNEAAACYHRSRSLAESVDDTRLIIYNYCNEGQLWLAEDDVDKAIDLLEKGLALVEKADWGLEYRNQLMPEILSSLSEAYTKTGTYDLAQKQAERALELARQENQLHQMAHAYQSLALIASQRNDSWVKVTDYFNESKSLWEKMGASADLGRLLVLEATYWQTQDDVSKSRACLDLAIRCFEKAGLDKELSTARDQLSQLV